VANMLIGWSDWGDAATITDSSTETTGFEATQVQATQPTDYWESQANEPYLVLDRGSSQTFNVVALLFTNLPADSTWRIRAADDEASLTDGTETYDSGVIDFRVPGDDDTWDRHHGLHYISAGVTARWLRIDISPASVLSLDFVSGAYSLTGYEGTLEAGRLIVGNLFQPNANDSYGRQFGPVDPSSVARSDTGALYADDRTPYLAADITLGFLSEAEAYGTMFGILRRRGRRNDVLYVGDPAEDAYLMQQIIYGHIIQSRPIVLPQFDRYQVRLRIEEML